MNLANIPAKLYPTFQRLTGKLRFSGNTSTIILACLVGIIGGYGAIGFRYLITNCNKFFLWFSTYFENLLFAGEESFMSLGALPWYWKLFVPAFGGLIVGLIVYLWAREAKGHGVPEVMEAVVLKQSRIRVRIVALKALASAICIGSGGSVGREGPIVHIGSAMGSAFGQFLKVPNEIRKVLLGCGAAAGIAATFNAPIAGAIFAVEIILGDFTASKLMPIFLSSTVATIVSRVYLGDYPAFVNLTYQMKSAWEVGPYLLLGIICGIAALAYTSLLYKTEDLFDSLNTRPYVKPLIGGLIVGGIGIYLPQVFGVGYSTVDGILSTTMPLALLFALFFAKLLATSVTLGSGGSGGVFAPSLFMGASLGGAFGEIVHMLAPGVTAEGGAYALVGMGAMVAGATHAPITSIMILFEMTNDYKIIIPLMLSCISAYMISRFLKKDSIYSLKLSRRGVNVHAGREESIMSSLYVKDIMRRDVVTLRRDMPFDKVVETVLGSSEINFFVIDREDILSGMISIHNVKDFLQEEGLEGLILADDIMMTNVPFITPEDTLADTMREFSARFQDVLPVVESSENRRFLGVLNRSLVIDAYNREILKQSAMGIRFMSGRENERSTAFVDLSTSYITKEVTVPKSFIGKCLKDLDLRARYGVHVIAIRKGGHVNLNGDQLPKPDQLLVKGDKIVVVGKNSDLEKLKDL